MAVTESVLGQSTILTSASLANIQGRDRFFTYGCNEDGSKHYSGMTVLILGGEEEEYSKLTLTNGNTIKVLEANRINKMVEGPMTTTYYKRTTNGEFQLVKRVETLYFNGQKVLNDNGQAYELVNEFNDPSKGKAPQKESHAV